MTLNWVTRYLMLAMLLSGCSADRPGTVPARGKVSINGRPLANAQLTFTPEKGPCATARTSADGTFHLSTFGDADGAIVAKHYVTVLAREAGVDNAPGAPGATQPGRTLIPLSYSNTATSGLVFEVAADGDNFFNIELASNARK